MGMGVEAAQIILAEHKLRPLTGRLLMIGRPSTWFSPELAMKLVRDAGCELRPGVAIDIDTYTVAARNSGQRWISDKGFFELFTDAEVVTVDVTDYEGAEIVHDMCKPLPDQMRGAFDFIFDGSSLDNIFDPATAIKNFALALNDRGRILHQNHGSPHSGPYLMYPSEWFFDYYLVNRFADCRVHLGFFADQTQDDIVVQTFGWEPFVKSGENWRAVTGQMQPHLPPGLPNVAVIVLAEKAPHSTHDKTPVQYVYRHPADHPSYKVYLETYLEMRKSPRRWLSFADDADFRAAFTPSAGFTYIGRRTRPDDPWLSAPSPTGNAYPDLRARVSELEATLEAMRNSKSWRITKPLRDFAGRLRA